jgi:hypothetical protein
MHISHPCAGARAEIKPFYDNCHKRTLDGLTDPQNPLSLHLNKDGASVKFNDDDADASHD